jgi:hypothetical protein
VLVAVLLISDGLLPSAAAQAADPSDVVLVLDFSASILNNATARNQFGGALERIAARVDAIAADLVAGDATVTIVQFAAKAADVGGCTDLKLLGNPANVARLATCLRGVAGGYRRGLDPALAARIGFDTNYVAAMEQAAKHLPQTSIRPALILFTDGKHDVAGVPVTAVLPARDRLFGSRSPFALLPVGMGLDPAERGALASGLEQLRVTRDMPACASGSIFSWPQVVFDTADAAGTAVGVALQDATCTFTVAPTPSPTPAPVPAPVTNIRLKPGDGQIELAWTAPTAKLVPVVDYQARCRAGEGDWIESKEGVSTEPKATVAGLTNGLAYQCEVAAVGGAAAGAWTAAPVSATPVGRPAAPPKPTVEALNGRLQVGLPPDTTGTVKTYHFECSADNGATWPEKIDASPTDPTTQIGSLTNGVDYVCRAFAENPVGISDASPVSDLVRPCGSPLECNPVLLPIVGGLGLLLLAGILIALVALIRGRSHGHVVAVVDVIHTANIGHGSSLGIAFLRDTELRTVTGIVADRTRKADVRIRHLRGDRFVVRDKFGRHVVADGEPVVVADSTGVRHSLVLHAFSTASASEVASRR